MELRPFCSSPTLLRLFCDYFESCLLQVAGLPTNLGFLQDLAAHPAFAVDLDLDTGFIERHRSSLLPLDESVAPEVAALAGALWGKLAVSTMLVLEEILLQCWAPFGYSGNGYVSLTVVHILSSVMSPVPSPAAVCRCCRCIQAAAAAGNEGSGSRGGAMAAWDAGDSKRLWHKLERKLPVRLAESEQQMELAVTYDSGSSFEVG